MRPRFIAAAAAAVALWLGAAAGSVLAADRLGNAARGAWIEAQAEFEARAADADAAMDLMDGELDHAAFLRDRADARVEDPQVLAELDAAYAAGIEEVARLRATVDTARADAGSVRPGLPPLLAPMLWLGAADALRAIPLPTAADFQPESTAILSASTAVERARQDWNAANADALAARVAQLASADLALGRATPDGLSSNGVDGEFAISGPGGDEELALCDGLVDLRAFLSTAAVVGVAWQCGGSDFPRWPGAIVRLTGDGPVGVYRVEGTVAYVEVAEWEFAALPAGYDLLLETEHPERPEFLYVGLTRVMDEGDGR